MNRSTLSLAIAGLALALAGPAASAGTVGNADTIQLAQAGDSAASTPPRPVMTKPHVEPNEKVDRDQHRRYMCETADAHHAAALAFAETRMKLTEAQKPVWSKVVEASNVGHQDMVKLMCSDLKDVAAVVTLPDRLARAEQWAQARLARIQTLRPALEELYKILTPAQQAIADTLPFGLRGHRHGSHPMQHG